MTDNRPIAFFDSGVGLLSVLINTQKILPLENFIVFADQGHNPYGEKSKGQIRKFALDATNFLIREHNIKMMVLACNTASVLALSYLREKFPIPIIGVVPAVKPALKSSTNKKIAVMSTPATAKSKYLDDLIRQYSKGFEVLRLGCTGLEEAIEILDTDTIEALLDKYISVIGDFGADTVVLGCTHYPLVKSQITKRLLKVKLVDSGKAVARNILKSLEKDNLTSTKRTGDIYYTTGNPELFSKVATKILNKRITSRKIA